MTGGRDETHQPSWERRLSLPAYRYGEAARLAQATWQAVARWQREYDRSANQRDTIALRRPKLLSYLQQIGRAHV